MSQWQNRIVGSGAEAPDQLLANPENWRIHPLSQQQALGDVLDQVGWVQQVIVNKTTGHLVDGHLRVALSISRGEPEVPVVYVELTEQEERLVLASLDPLAGLAVTDAEQLRGLIEQTEAEGEHLRNLMADLAAGATPFEDLATGGQVANDTDFWPVIRLQVSPDRYREWSNTWNALDGETDDDKLAALLELAG